MILVKIKSRKANINLLENWVEYTFFIVLIIGFIVAIFAGSAFFNYINIFLAGIFGGRFLYYIRKGPRFQFYLIVLGFLLGYLVGIRYGSWKITLLSFLIGAALSYYIHKKKYIE